MIKQKKLPFVLLTLYVPFFVWLALEPHDRFVWAAETLPVLAVVLVLALTYKKFYFSNWSYFFMSFWIFWHTVGGHYTFERVPFEMVNEFFGWERNMFDRFGHFMIGFFAFPIAEYFYRKKYSSQIWFIFTFALFSIMSLAAAYELFEWQFAVIFGGEAGASFLGSQGDIWDAQKDMLADTLGAIFSLLIFVSIHHEVWPTRLETAWARWKNKG